MLDRTGYRLFAIALCFIGSVLSSIAAAWAMNSNAVVMDKHVEQACYREVKTRTPLGHRDIQTVSYRQESALIAVARGSAQAQVSPNSWSNVQWSCRIDQKRGRVLRVEFGRSTSTSKLLAASMAF